MAFFKFNSIDNTLYFDSRRIQTKRTLEMAFIDKLTSSAFRCAFTLIDLIIILVFEYENYWKQKKPAKKVTQLQALFSTLQLFLSLKK